MPAIFLILATVSAYPPRYPLASDAARKQAAEKIRRQDPSLTVEADAYGFIQFVTGPNLIDAQGGMEIVRRNAALFGVDDPSALKNIGGPQSVAYVQTLDREIVARINIERYRIDRPEWRITGHFWPHLVPPAAGTPADPVRKRIVGAHIRYTEDLNPYPCDPVSGDHRDCPPKKPPRVTEFDVAERDVYFRTRGVLLRARDGTMELRTVHEAWIDLKRFSRPEVLRGTARLVLDAVTGEDLTAKVR